jgi:hypothetical protein
MTSRTRRFRVTLSDLDVHRLEGLAERSGLTFAAEASLLLVVGIRAAERRWMAIDGQGDMRRQDPGMPSYSINGDD